MRRVVSDTVLYELSESVATITLHRPTAMNALNSEMKMALRAAVERARDDDEVRAVVLTGAGRAFCAGQDLREHASALETGGGLADTVREHYNPIALAVAGMPKPVIAAVNGVAAGAGASLTFACDFRIAADKASFLMAFSRVGLSSDTGAAWTLQRLVGRARAIEMLMLAEPVDATTALSQGLVGAVIGADRLAGTARELALRLAGGPTRAYGAIKDSLNFGATHGLEETLEREALLQAELGATEDHRAATHAFVNKQRPQFNGR